MPKCLVKVNGIPIINYQLHLVRNIPNVYIVVGYCEHDVMEHVRHLRDDVIFVRNPNFKHTSTLQSLALAARGMNSMCICMDGDMVIEEQSFERFLAQCRSAPPCIAVSPEITTGPVYTYIQDEGGDLYATGFGRERQSAYEWANIAWLPASWLTFEYTHFYQRLHQYLPLAAVSIRRAEVDTAEDLDAANALLRDEPGYCRFFM